MYSVYVYLCGVIFLYTYNIPLPIIQGKLQYKGHDTKHNRMQEGFCQAVATSQFTL